MKDQLYKVYGLINGKWMCLNSGGIPKVSAESQAKLQAVLRRCPTKIKPSKK